MSTGKRGSHLRPFAHLKGSISADELEAAFVNLGFKFSKPQFVKIFAKVDADGSGFVDFQEYVVVSKAVACEGGKRGLRAFLV